MPHDETYLLYVLLAARRVVESTAGISRAAFDGAREKKDSVALQIGNMGEAANQISDDFRRQHATIPWSKIVGMRHRIFHHYLEIDWNIVWVVATEEVPEIIRYLEPLVPPDPEQS